jgi:hypothetical protein
MYLLLQGHITQLLIPGIVAQTLHKKSTIYKKKNSYLSAISFVSHQGLLECHSTGCSDLVAHLLVADFDSLNLLCVSALGQ